ncbi:hypothetical protein [Streptomyces sp. NPDC051657]|uniref:hypothetical protein n=1 Tax=unclassified Streptomyces TaxID=2593676 RepID=UPI00343D975F
MPEWIPFLLLAVLLAVAVRCLTTALHTGRRGTPPEEPFRDRREFLACHRPSCGHNERPHDETDEGLRCTGCGEINTPSS